MKNSYPNATESFHNRLVETLNNLPDKKECRKMNSKHIKRNIIAAACAVMLIGTCVFAGSNMGGIIGSSSSIPEYKSLPSQSDIKNDTEIDMTPMESFSNGYVFDNGSISNNKNVDENGEVTAEYKSLSLRYAKDNDEVILSVTDEIYQPISEEKQPYTSYNGISISNESYTAKFVPADYKMTSQDMNDEASGKYVFSYGSKDVEIKDIKSLSFVIDGTKYTVMAMDSPLSLDEILEMAHDVIDNN